MLSRSYSLSRSNKLIFICLWPSFFISWYLRCLPCVINSHSHVSSWVPRPILIDFPDDVLMIHNALKCDNILFLISRWELYGIQKHWIIWRYLSMMTISSIYPKKAKEGWSPMYFIQMAAKFDFKTFFKLKKAMISIYCKIIKIIQ